MNHRMGRRIQTSQRVSLDIPGLSDIHAELLNISLSGAAVRTNYTHLIEPYMPVNMRLHLSDSTRAGHLCVEGFVVRMSDSLVGIMFMRERIELVNRLRLDPESQDETTGRPLQYGAV